MFIRTMAAKRIWRVLLAVVWILVALFAVVDSRIAGPTHHHHHLESIFNKYSKNGSISRAGLENLVHSADLDHLRMAMAEHHGERTSQDASNASFHNHDPFQLGSITDDHRTDTSKPHLSRNTVTAWVGGFVSVTVITLASLLGVFLIPLMNHNLFKYLLVFMVALAVGTLCGDAFLHLIPHSQSGHPHHHHDDLDEHADVHEEHEDSLDGVWKGLMVLVGISVMFIMEHLLTLGRKIYNERKHNSGDPSVAGNRMGFDQEGQVMPPGSADMAGVPTHQRHHKSNPMLNQNPQGGIAALAWLVLMGDGMHNFSDGLAIGAAFTDGLASGLSTSLAVFCHELPHELGDFAVLLKAGMKVRQAILYNLLSAMFAYVGMVIGLIIGHYHENIVVWIFPFTAGLFLYVALVDMLPDLIHNVVEDQGFNQYGLCLLENAGIWLGFGIMLLIAIYETKLRVDLG